VNGRFRTGVASGAARRWGCGAWVRKVNSAAGEEAGTRSVPFDWAWLCLTAPDFGAEIPASAGMARHEPSRPGAFAIYGGNRVAEGHAV
jgi:hypothetical protein